jgi:hypothetical protein
MYSFERAVFSDSESLAVFSIQSINLFSISLARVVSPRIKVS